MNVNIKLPNYILQNVPLDFFTDDNL